jgi:hypothetical protein
MQNFGNNDAMAGYVSLESIAKIYAATMDAWVSCAESLSLQWHSVRYEDLIADLEVQCRSLFDFLGVGWSDSVLEHVEHAKTRVIKTPSYHQVTQPIYQHAKYRWKRYASEFEAVLPTLQPFIERFGYRD